MREAVDLAGRWSSLEAGQTATADVPLQRSIPMCSALARTTLLAASTAAVLIGSKVSAQGCEPIRFTTPVSLGGQGEAYQRKNEWRLTLGYRRLASNEWFIGTEDASSRGPGGQSPVFRINTLIADIAFAPTERLQFHLGVPFSGGSFSVIWPDKLKHSQSVKGIGDISVLGEAWLLSPKTHQGGNVSFGLGIKAPTGRNDAASYIYTATAAVPYPADQTVQPGDGGWGILLQSQAFRQVTERVYGYAFGSYTVNPKARGDVQFRPSTPGVYWSVPDTYSARAGAAFSILPDQGLTMSLGGRMDGIPLRDLIGGGDDSTIKRTSRVIFVDPGLSLTRGKDNFTVSVPWRVRVNRFQSLYERRTNGLNAGGFAKYLIFASYARRI